MDQHLKVAVIGGGVSGITAAYLLQRKHAVTLYEKNSYIGGHTHTVLIEKGPDLGMPIDTGFIVMNNRTYPLFSKLLSDLGVSISETDMSFSYYCKTTGLQYGSSGLNSLFAQRKNLFRPSFWNLLREILRFFRKTRRALKMKSLQNITLGEFIQREGFSARFAEQYVIPMASAIWSEPDDVMTEFPMETFARFFDNHGLLSAKNHPQWYYVSGGSHSYVNAFLKGFNGTVFKEKAVHSVHRIENGVKLNFQNGTTENVDRVVIAVHADEAFSMLGDPSQDERNLLSPWKYSRNRVFLHTDPSFLPPVIRARGSWNYIREDRKDPKSPITLTYDMNRLQKLKTKNNYCVTLNPKKKIPERFIIKEMEYTHPEYTFQSLATQPELKNLNGKRNTYFCGSYFGYGFHEDAVRSASDVAELFGVIL